MSATISHLHWDSLEERKQLSMPPLRLQNTRTKMIVMPIGNTYNGSHYIACNVAVAIALHYLERRPLYGGTQCPFRPQWFFNSDGTNINAILRFKKDTTVLNVVSYAGLYIKYNMLATSVD